MDRPVGHFVYDVGDFRVDSMQRLLLLRASGRALPLNSRAFDTLLFFLENRGKLLDKSTLMAAVWPNVVVEENNLNQHISALRRVLGETRDDHRFIVTEPGRAITLDAIRDGMATAGVARFKWPERLEIVAELPMTKMGKLDKRALRDWLGSNTS